LFVVDTVYTLRVQLGNLRKDTATTGEIIANAGLRIVPVSSFYKSTFVVISFSASFLGPNGEALSAGILTDGNMLSLAQKQAIKTLKRNDRILFSRIIVGGADTRRREIPPFTIVIK
jgi:GldM C-terminal domain